MADTESSSDEDVRIGRNVQELRKAQGMSQDDLARAMAAGGYPFHQPTIAKVEAGVRPLRVTEARALATVLECGLDELVREQDPFGLSFEIRIRERKVQEGWNTAREVIRQLVLDTRELASAQQRGRMGGKFAQSAAETAARTLQRDLLGEVVAITKSALAEHEARDREL